MRLISNKIENQCRSCGVTQVIGVEVWYDRSTRSITCSTCRDGNPPETASSDQSAGRSARTNLEQGTLLEQQVADIFRTHGYDVSTNVWLEGRGGSRYEIDVLATKTDPLITIKVGIECKAWRSKIDRSVISKFADICADAGIGTSIVVALSGAQPGADDAAQQRGVIIWGPEELETHTGRSVVSDLRNRPTVEELAVARSLSSGDAAEMAARESTGAFGLGKREITWSGDVWLPVALVHLTLQKIGLTGRLTSDVEPRWAVFSLVGGGIVSSIDVEPLVEPTDMDAPRIHATTKASEPTKAIEKTVGRWERAKTRETREQIEKELAHFGVPGLRLPTVGGSRQVWYPIHLAIVRKGRNERVVAIDAVRSRHFEPLSKELSAHIVTVKSSLDLTD